MQVNAVCLRKQGIGIEETLEAVVKRIPAPKDTASKPLRALIFDSHYDSYKVHSKLPNSHHVTLVHHGATRRLLDCESVEWQKSSCRSLHADVLRHASRAALSLLGSGCVLMLQWLQGVIVAFRVVDGSLRKGDTIRLMNTKKEYQVDEVGVRSPTPIEVLPSCPLSLALQPCRFSSVCHPLLYRLVSLVQRYAHQLACVSC